MPHLWPTGSSSGWPPSTAARYFSSCPSDPTSQWTPCPPEHAKRWLQVRLGRLQLSPSCPVRLLHTSRFLRPTRNYPRFRIWRPSSGRQRDFNPPDQHAAQRTLWGCLTSRVRSSTDCASLDFPPRPPSSILLRADTGSPGSRARCFRTCSGSIDHAGSATPRRCGAVGVAFCTLDSMGTRK